MRKSKLLVIRSNQFKKFSNQNNFRAPLRDPFFKTPGRYLVKIHHFFVGVKFMTLSYFFIKRSYFSIQNSISAIDQQLIQSNPCNSHLYIHHNYLVKIHHFFVGVNFMTLSYFFIKRSYFSMQNSMSAIDQQLIQSNPCASHLYIHNNYLVKIHHFFVGVKFMTLSYFFIKRSYFSMQNSIAAIDQQLIQSNPCARNLYIHNNYLVKIHHVFIGVKFMTLFYYFLKRSYFSMQNSISAIDQQLIQSNPCASHLYIHNIYLMF